MRYHSKQPDYYTTHYGELYSCDHPLYDNCTLFLIDGLGMAVIEQHFDRNTKSTYWGAIQEDWLPDTLYLHPAFKEYFDTVAGKPRNGLYPTVTVRKLMWYLKMKPLPKTYWETTFDRPIC